MILSQAILPLLLTLPHHYSPFLPPSHHQRPLPYHLTIFRPSIPSPPFPLPQYVKEDLSVERFSPVVTPEAPQLIVAYDEHALKHQFKFGLIVQRHGQTVEEELFSNTGQSPALEQFLGLMGRRVKLREHDG